MCLTFLFSKSIYFEGGKMSLQDLALTVSLETNKDIVISENLKNKIVFLRVGKVISTNKLFNYFKALIDANGLSLNYKKGFWIVAPFTDLKYFSYRFKYRNALDFKPYVKNYKNSCSLGKNLLFCNLIPKKYKIVSKMVKAFDIPIPKDPFKNKTLDIHIKVLESNYSDLLDLQNKLTFKTDTNNIGIDSSLSKTFLLGLNLFLGRSSVVSSASFGLLFNYLQKNGFSTVVNEPNILVTNNSKTTINTGGSQRVISSISKTKDLSAQTTQYENFVSGLQLSISSKILSLNKIKLSISLNNENVIGGTPELPITSKQTYNTVITLDSNQTIVLGGVIYEKTSNVKSKVPFLGDIPLLGIPFRNVTKNKEKKVLTITINAKVLR
jgi:hypothetical protein